jgi:hypothetical protein
MKQDLTLTTQQISSLLMDIHGLPKIGIDQEGV